MARWSCTGKTGFLPIIHQFIALAQPVWQLEVG